MNLKPSKGLRPPSYLDKVIRQCRPLVCCSGQLYCLGSLFVQQLAARHPEPRHEAESDVSAEVLDRYPNGEESTPEDGSGWAEIHEDDEQLRRRSSAKKSSAIARLRSTSRNWVSLSPQHRRRPDRQEAEDRDVDHDAAPNPRSGDEMLDLSTRIVLAVWQEMA